MGPKLRYPRDMMFHISLQLGVVEDQHWAVEELQRGKLPRSSMRWAMLRNLLRKKGHRAFISGGYVDCRTALSLRWLRAEQHNYSRIAFQYANTADSTLGSCCL